MLIIDAHCHLWLRQEAVVNGKEIRPLPNGRCMFMGTEVQMLPPFLIDGRNTAEVLLSNMDYAQVSAAVVTQEFIDGLQNDYLEQVELRYPERFFVFGMCEFRKPGLLDSPEMMEMFRLMEDRDMILHVELADGDLQVAEMESVIAAFPRLRILIGHFGMVTRPGWMEQIRLARHPNVYVECGGITWLFNDEFYPFPSAVQAIREAADEVGFDKLMWGSDYPRTITAITYKMSYDFIVKSPLLTDGEKAKFLGENARRLFGFGDLPIPKHVKNMSE